MTEAEAKQKWCPFATSRVVMYVERDRDHFVVLDSESGEGKILLCVASGCMAWRWTAGEEWHGYCGLAGAR